MNTVLANATFGFLPTETLTRKLTAIVSERVPLSLVDPSNDAVFSFLVEKKLVGAKKPKASGRYQDVALFRDGAAWMAVGKSGQSVDSVAVYRTDLWFADPRLPSTVGVPTPDNVAEVIELVHQLGLLTRTKNTWTAAGQLMAGMRARYADTLDVADNPFVLGFESVALLRQVLEVDGLLIRHLVEHLVRYQGQRIRRNTIALDLPSIATLALDDARRLRRPPHEIATAKSFVELLKSTGAKRGTQSSAPGVLEHRTAPRLEWLTDFGVLSKADLPKNGFEYSLTADAPLLSRELSKPVASENWAADASLAYWRSSAFHRGTRNVIGQVDVEASILGGYRIMQRTVGPASIRDVAFAASALCSDLGMSFGDMIDRIVLWSANTEGVTVSGGRFSRGPELVHVTPRLLGE